MKPIQAVSFKRTSMPIVVTATLLLWMSCNVAQAYPIWRFQDADQYVAKATDIVVAECTAAVEEGGSRLGMMEYEGKILKVLKGNRKLGAFRFVAVMEAKPHTTYLLCTRGGKVGEVDFVAVPEMALVPLPPIFKLEELQNKDLKEQVQFIFSLRLFEVERQLAPLLEEKAMLDKAVADRAYEHFESKGAVVLGDIVQSISKTDGSVVIDLQGDQLQWSHSEPGKSGHVCYEKTGQTPWVPYWEFSRCEASNVEDLAGEPLKARFYGLFTPGRPGRAGLQQSISVKVGEVILARTVSKPGRVFVVQFVEQKLDNEEVMVRYAVIRD